MTTIVLALPVVALVSWLSYRAGKRRMARDAVIVMRLVQDGEAHVTEDGTVRMADSDYVEDQREVAVWQ